MSPFLRHLMTFLFYICFPASIFYSKGKEEPSIWSAFTWSWIVCNSFHRWERSSLSPYQSVLPALLSCFFNKGRSSYSTILLSFLLPGIFSGRTIPCNEYIASSTITLFTGQVFLLLWKTYSLLRCEGVFFSYMVRSLGMIRHIDRIA